MARSLLAIMQLVIDGWWCGLCLLFERGKKKKKAKGQSKKGQVTPSLLESAIFLFFYRLFITSEKNGRRKAWNLHSTESSRLFSFLLERATSIGSTRWRPWYSIELQSRLERKGLYCILVD
jgi:hypothetical protein